MNLLLRRDQRSGLLGRVVFSLDVRADISPEELEHIRRYQLGDAELYVTPEIEGGQGFWGAASRFAWKIVRLRITVNDLASGKRVEAKDIVEMLAIEEQIKVAATTFKQVLDAAAHFGGEEVVTI